jgi:hypothetical protein
MDERGMERMLRRTLASEGVAATLAEAFGFDPANSRDAGIILDIDFVEEHFADMTAEHVAEAMKAALPDVATMRVNPFATLLMERYGVPPGMLAGFSMWATRAAYHHADDGTAIGLNWNRNRNVATVTAHLDGKHGIVWDHEDGDRSMLHVRIAVPDTVLTGLSGRRLMDFVSHPVLDTMDVTIVSAHRTDDDHTLLEIEVPRQTN